MIFFATLTCMALLQDSEIPPAELPVRPQFFLPPTFGPMLADIKMQVRVTSAKAGQSGVVTFPVPSDYSGQTVIGFEVQTDPPKALKSWSYRARADGLNKLVKVTVAPQGGDVTVSYSARILVPGFQVLRTQHKDFKSWLAPTASVESSDPEIIGVVKQLSANKPSRGDFVGRVVKWVAMNRLEELEILKSSDAKSALETGGDSLSRADLCAAILRAAKIPARIISYAPNWGQRMDAEVWLTEYESDENNWSMIQPLVGIQFPVRNSAVVLSISSRVDENQRVPNPLALRPDAPSYSTPEISRELAWSPTNGDLRHTTIQVIRNFPRSSGARLMPAGFRSSAKVIESAKLGKASWFDESVFKKVISKGPITWRFF